MIKNSEKVIMLEDDILCLRKKYNGVNFHTYGIFEMQSLQTKLLVTEIRELKEMINELKKDKSRGIK